MIATSYEDDIPVTHRDRSIATMVIEQQKAVRIGMIETVIGRMPKAKRKAESNGRGT